MKWVFISHPYKDDPKGNKKLVDTICRELAERDDIPVSYTHLDVYKRQVQVCEALECPVAVAIDLYLHGKRRIDVDNCAKSILDGMNGIVYEDDNQVVDLRVRKLRESNRKNQRVEVEVWEAGENAGTG